MKKLTQIPLIVHILILSFLFLLVFILSTGMGYIAISPFEAIKIIISKLLGIKTLASSIDSTKLLIVTDVRLPRIICASLVGVGLSISGVIFQGLLLNPLADPYTLGISAGAAFGAALALVCNINFAGVYSLPIYAFLGAILTLFSVLSLSSSKSQYSSNNLILSGIIIATILSAGINFLKYLAHERVSIIVFWLMGSFSSKTWLETILMTVFVLIALPLAQFYARDLNIIALGERSALTLGVNIKRVRLTLLVVASFITATCVSISGIIGFIGLIIPHLMRFIVGPDNHKLIPVSALAGALLLLSADTVTRAILPTEVPIGILTALLGGPFFCYIFKKRQIRKDNG